MFGTNDVRRECPKGRVVQLSKEMAAKLEEAARTKGRPRGDQRGPCAVGAALHRGETRAPPT